MILVYYIKYNARKLTRQVKREMFRAAVTPQSVTFFKKI